MIKFILLGTIFICLFNIAAHAGPKNEKTGRHKEEIGLGMGAIIGGLIAGPPGAIIGAAGGAWYGDRRDKQDNKLATLETRLLEKQTELARLQGEFADLESRHGTELKKVRLDQQLSAAEKLSRGISLTVFFRTGSYSLDTDITPHIQHLAEYLQAFPEIQLHLEAHADQRGSDAYNQKLSQQRADTVKQALIRFGLQASRIHSFAHGESLSTSAEGDTEGYFFDRRVNIRLSLDSASYAVNN